MMDFKLHKPFSCSYREIPVDALKTMIHVQDNE